MAKEPFSLVQTVRAACTSRIWSQGAILARQGAVHGLSESNEEIVLRVHVPGLPVDPTVVLYPEDDEWECDCREKSDNCSHVAAATIAVNQARLAGTGLPSSKSGGAKLEYRFQTAAGGLILWRFIVAADGQEEMLKTAMMSLVAHKKVPLGYSPSQDDLLADRIIGAPNRAALPPAKLANVFRIMAGMENVFLDKQPVTISDEPLLPNALVETSGDGIKLTISHQEQIDQVVAAGVVRCGAVLRTVGEPKISGHKMERLPATTSYPKAELANFVTEVLPDLQNRIPIQIKSRRLPEISSWEKPRLVMEMKQQDGGLQVLPTLVYGTPPHVRIDNGNMVYLEGPAPVRDRQEERNLLTKLRDDMNLVTGRRVVFAGKDAMRFVHQVQQWSEDTLDNTQQSFYDVGPLTPQLQIEEDCFHISFDLENERLEQFDQPENIGRRADANSVLSAWREGLSMVPLEGGGWAPIPQEWLDRHGHLVSDLLLARMEDDRVAAAALPALAQLCDDLEMPRPTGFTKLAPLIDGFETIPKAELPQDLKAELRDYQKQGIDWLCFLKRAGLGAILADDMGLGKTIQALCAIKGKTLVVCPTSVLHNWANEIDRFRPGLPYHIYHGPKRSLESPAEVLITTYALLRIDAEKLQQQQWDNIVLDEAQNIKNPDSQVARAAFKLKGSFCLALSGTPVENRLEELWSQFHFCNRGLLGGRQDFQRRYAQPIAAAEPGAAARLREKVKPFVLRRMKQAVAPELPPRTDQVLHCVLDDKERQIYDAVRATTNKEVVAQLQKGGSVLKALEVLLRLRQASCHSALVPGQEAATSSKLDLLLSRLEITLANGHNALVFSQWTSLLDLVEPHFEQADISYSRLDGSTRNRAAVVEAFQNSTQPSVLLISLKAGGTGLNLTAADHVFLLDPWWNPAVEDQAADRTHRIGQDKPVMVYRLVAKETVEERILQLQYKKRALAEAALGDAEGAAALTREDLLALLR